MSNLTVIIPSKSASNLVASVAAVRKHEPDARIIVVDDGVATGWNETFPDQVELDRFRFIPRTILFVDGVKPFVFAKNINLGIRAAGDDDVILLNDDAIFETPGGFSIMQSAAAASPEVGIIGAVTDLTGQPLQRRQRNVLVEEQARHVPIMGLRSVEHIAFVCVLIPARTRRMLADLTWQYENLFTGGFLDERYAAYGSDDLDYCMQVRKATMLVCVHDACYVNHGALQSSYRGAPTTAGDIWPNHRLLRAKWGLSPAINPADPLARGAR